MDIDTTVKALPLNEADVPVSYTHLDVAKEYAEAGARLRDWVDKGYLDADSLAMTREDATGQFYLQKGLFAFVNNNELTDLEKNSAEAGFERCV